MIGSFCSVNTLRTVPGLLLRVASTIGSFLSFNSLSPELLLLVATMTGRTGDGEDGGFDMSASSIRSYCVRLFAGDRRRVGDLLG